MEMKVEKRGRGRPRLCEIRSVGEKKKKYFTTCDVCNVTHQNKCVHDKTKKHKMNVVRVESEKKEQEPIIWEVTSDNNTKNDPLEYCKICGDGSKMTASHKNSKKHKTNEKVDKIMRSDKSVTDKYIELGMLSLLK